MPQSNPLIDTFLPLIFFISIIALGWFVVQRYLAWAATVKFLNFFLGFFRLKWWAITLGALTVVPLVLSVGVLAVGMIVWALGRTFRIIKKPAAPGKVTVISDPSRTPLMPHYEEAPPLLPSPEMQAKLRERQEAAREWQADVAARAKRQAGSVSNKGAFTTAIELQPGDLRIIRFGIKQFKEEHPEFRAAILHGYVAENVVHIQDHRHRVIGKYSILTQQVTREY